MSALDVLRQARSRSKAVASAHALLRDPYYRAMSLLFPSGIVTTLPGGCAVRLHCRLLGMRPDLYEPEIGTLLDRYASSGATVLDVGAHVGLHTLRLSQRVGPSGRVFAVEPSPVSANLLRKHVAWNAIHNVTVVEAVVGDREDVVEFKYRPDALDAGGFANSIAYDIGGEAALVRMMTIDSICSQLAPDLIKIDVEGAEFLAIRGAQRTLLKSSPVIILAFHPDAMMGLGHQPSEILTQMASLGYVGRHLDGRIATEPGFEEIVFERAGTGIGSS